MIAEYVPARPIGSVPANAGRIIVIPGVVGVPITIETRLAPVPGTTAAPTRTNSTLLFVLRDQRFSTEALYEASWDSGIAPVDDLGLIRITIPIEITSALRRGSYDFSLLLTPMLSSAAELVILGHLLMEYETVSPHHSIPYKD